MDGLLSFPLTAFTPDLADVAVDAFREHVERQLDWVPDAIFVACGTGEFTALSIDEYAVVVRAAVERTGRRTPVYAGVGGGTQIARAFAETAAAAGADGLLLLPPYLVDAPKAGIVGYVRHVAAATPLPLIVYQRANAVLDPESALTLLDIPTVAGIKDGHGDIDLMGRLISAIRTSGHARADGFRFLNGLPTAELSALAYAAIGAPAYSSAVATFVPEIATAFAAAVARGDLIAVQALTAGFYAPFARLRARVPGYAVSLVKAGARAAGAAVGGVRPPLVDPTPRHEAELAELVAAGRAALAASDGGRAHG